MRTNDCLMNQPGNVRPDVLTYRKDLDCYHLQVETRILNPADMTHPIVKVRILVLRPMDYKKYLQCSGAEQIEWLRTMNFSSASLVWDPCRDDARKLNAIVKSEQMKERESLGTTSEARSKESLRAAKIGDIEKLLKEKK